MMGGHLARDADAAFLPGANGAERLPRAHVRDVHVCICQLRERDIPLDHDRFGLTGNAPQSELGGHVSLMRHAVAFE